MICKTGKTSAYIKLVSLYYLGWRIVTVVMCLIVFIPLITLYIKNKKKENKISSTVILFKETSP